MIRSTGFKTYRMRSSAYRGSRFGIFMGGLVERSGWVNMVMPWSNVERLNPSDSRRIYNSRFRSSQLGWRSYMGKAPVHRR